VAGPPPPYYSAPLLEEMFLTEGTNKQHIPKAWQVLLNQHHQQVKNKTKKQKKEWQTFRGVIKLSSRTYPTAPCLCHSLRCTLVSPRASCHVMKNWDCKQFDEHSRPGGHHQRCCPHGDSSALSNVGPWLKPPRGSRNVIPTQT